tara:strand:- start:935 stop:1303 length:369 start_codon:yes stop_codon:yes gene_type:complete
MQSKVHTRRKIKKNIRRTTKTSKSRSGRFGGGPTSKDDSDRKRLAEFDKEYDLYKDKYKKSKRDKLLTTKSSAYTPKSSKSRIKVDASNSRNVILDAKMDKVFQEELLEKSGYKYLEDLSSA